MGKRIVILLAVCLMLISFSVVSAIDETDGYKGPALTTDPITIRILGPTMENERGNLWEAQIAEFTAEYPNITIEMDQVPWGNLTEKTQAVLASGNYPDIIFSDGPFIKSYASLGLLLPLDPYMTDEYIADYVPATLAEHSFEGHIYAPPTNQSSLALAYNKDMTDAAGIVPPSEIEDSWTWDEALEAWQKLQQDPSGTGTPEVWGLAPSIFGTGGPGYYYRDGIWIRSNGDPNADPESSAYKTFWGVNEDGDNVTGYINTPEGREAMEWYQKLTTEWKVTPLVGIPNSFVDAKAAMDITDDYVIGDAAFFNPDLNLGVTYVPYFKTQITMTGSNTWMAMATTEHPAEVAAFLIWLHNTENSYKLWQAQGTMPAQYSVYDQIETYHTDPYKVFYTELVNVGQPRPQTPGWLEYETIINPVLRDIALGGDVESLLSQAETDINEVLEKYK